MLSSSWRRFCQVFASLFVVAHRRQSLGQRSAQLGRPRMLLDRAAKEFDRIRRLSAGRQQVGQLQLCLGMLGIEIQYLLKLLAGLARSLLCGQGLRQPDVTGDVPIIDRQCLPEVLPGGFWLALSQQDVPEGLLSTGILWSQGKALAQEASAS